jgi:hypothetical protein
MFKKKMSWALVTETTDKQQHIDQAVAREISVVVIFEVLRAIDIKTGMVAILSRVVW